MDVTAAGDIFIRPLDATRDGPGLHAIFGDEASCRYLTSPPTASVAQTVLMLTAWQSAGPDISWTLALSPDGPAVGRIAVYARGRNNVWEAACMIAPHVRGRNLAARALSLALDQAFDDRGARRIIADIDPDNAPSIRVFEKLGFTCEGRLRGEWEMHIGIRDSLIYGLLREDPRPWRTH